eukprot:NODE_8805_length_1468_cov_10.201342.p1 GENE.NODE_8805_length_1468_cov_10.201342~~NODE_8805_length_1468_cov_10.201342.p1  ORF type:complete len:270 (+),score=45.01 NODE_8805_length_1468_cov_10.201342:277-1086(+)
MAAGEDPQLELARQLVTKHAPDAVVMPHDFGPPTGRGLRCLRAVKAGEPFLRIPLSCCVTAERAKSDVLALLSITAADVPTLTLQDYLCLWLLQERTKGSASVKADFIAMLPKEGDVPAMSSVCWPTSALALLLAPDCHDGEGGIWARLLRSHGADIAVHSEAPTLGRDGRTLLLLWPDLHGIGEIGLKLLGRYEGTNLLLVGEWRGRTLGLVNPWGQSFSEGFVDRVEGAFEETRAAVPLPTWPLYRDVVAFWRRRRGTDTASLEAAP